MCVSVCVFSYLLADGGAGHLDVFFNIGLEELRLFFGIDRLELNQALVAAVCVCVCVCVRV